MKRLHRAAISGCTTAERGWILSCALTAPSPFARRPSMSTPPQTCSAQWRVPPSKLYAEPIFGGLRLERWAVQRVRAPSWRRLGGLDRVREDACQSLRRSGRAAAGDRHCRGTQAQRGTEPLLLECGIGHIAEHAEVGGKRYDKEVWHEFFARRFGLCDEVTLPDGEVVVRRKSTTQMTVGEFSDYLHAVQAYAVMRLRVEFE